MTATVNDRIRKLDGERESYERRQTWAANLRDEAQSLRYRAALERRRGAPDAAARLEHAATLVEREADEWEQGGV